MSFTTKKCISDRIQNYIEMFMDRIRYGFEYDLTKYVFKNKEGGYYNTDYWSYGMFELFKYVERRRRYGMVREQDIEEFERMRHDMIEFYLSNVRGEMEYTNKNPKTVAAAIIFRYMYPNHATIRVILNVICEVKSILTVKKMFSNIPLHRDQYDFILKGGFSGQSWDHEHPTSIGVYCDLSPSYKYNMWGIWSK